MTNDLQLVIATGLFSLGGVLLGALMTPIVQFWLERKREQRAADRAKLLIAGELLQVQLFLRTASEGKEWPQWEDVSAVLPTSAWQENKSILIEHITEDLWNQLVIAYAGLEHDRLRFTLANKIHGGELLTSEVAMELKDISINLGRLHRQLGGGGGWPDEFEQKLN